MHHGFNVFLAKMYSVNEAIILQHIYYWYKHNKLNNKNFYDGRYWTYNSISAFAEEFIYLSEKQIRNIIDKLIENNLVITGNYNKIAYDRTKWYSLTENAIELLISLGIHQEQENKKNASSKKVKSILPNQNIHLPKWENGITEKGEPIPDINTNINTNINTEKESKTKSNDFDTSIKESNLIIDFYLKEGKYNLRGNLYFKENELETLKSKWNADKLEEYLDSLDNWLYTPKNFKLRRSHYLTVNKWLNDAYNNSLKNGFAYQVDLEWKANNNDNRDYTDIDMSKQMLVEDF